VRGAGRCPIIRAVAPPTLPESPLNRFVLLLIVAPLLGAAAPARAAEGYDSCTGFITTLPAVIATQGTFCFNKDLSSNLGTGAAITVATNNVTIDCNGFKLGGLSAGAGTLANGIVSSGRQNTTVRGCSIRGFLAGVVVDGVGSGHLIVDNRFDGNRFGGIVVQGEGMQVLRNRVFDTGAGAAPMHAVGIAVTGGSAEVRDNLVYGVEATAGGDNDGHGILAQALDFGRIAGNSVRYVAGDGAGTGYGIDIQGALHLVVDDNHVANHSADSTGIACTAGDTLLRDNFVQGFGESIAVDCGDAGGNTTVAF
jgi:hypothetical protein